MTAYLEMSRLLEPLYLDLLIATSPPYLKLSWLDSRRSVARTLLFPRVPIYISLSNVFFGGYLSIQLPIYSAGWILFTFQMDYR